MVFLQRYMDRPLPLLGVVLALAALPVALFFPPSVYPSALPAVLLLLAPGFLVAVHSRKGGLGVCWLYMATGCVATVLSTSYFRASLGFLLTALAFGAAWTAGRYGGRFAWEGCAWLMALIGTLLGLHGLYQVAYGLEQSVDAARALGVAGEIVHRMRAGRAFARFPLPAQLGAFFLLSIPITLRLGLREWNRRQRAEVDRRWRAVILGALAPAVLLQLGGFLATLSLGAFVAAALGCGYLLILRIPRRRVLLPVAGLLLFGALITLTLRPEWAGLQHPSNPIRLRLSNWGVAVRMATEHPVAGVGFGCFGIRYPAYMQQGMNETKFAHNVPLQLAAEAGLWILPPLVLGLIALSRRASRRGSGVQILSAAAVVSFALANLWDFHLYLPSLGIPFFLVLGSWFGETPPVAQDPPARRAKFRVALLAAGSVAALFSAAWLGQVDRLKLGALDSAAASNWEQTIRAVESWQAVDPWDADPHGFEAELRSHRIGAGAGLQAAKAALERDAWTPFRHAAVAREAEALGDPVSALVRLESATRLFPEKERYRRERDRVRKLLAGRYAE